MTNFQSAEALQRRWITPERAVLVLPVLGGAVLAVLVLMFGLSPLLVQVQQRRSAVEEMQRKESDLPLLKRQLDALLQRQLDAQAQQQRLLELVAGKAPLSTWLTQINRLAAQQGLAILSVEPQPIERYRPPVAPAAEGDRGDRDSDESKSPPPPPADPLLTSTVEKHSVLLVLQGPFPRLVAFLQQLEFLQVIVTASDLELEQVPTPVSTAQPAWAPPPPQQTKLKLRLSAYGRLAAAAPSVAEDRATPAGE
jgi:hypothetical protein